MIIKELYIKNFLPFKGEKKMSFSSSNAKNITVFIAENNVGKTSLLKAFIWILYGTNKEDGDKVLNEQIRLDIISGSKGNANSVSGRLILEHNNIRYCIERTWIYSHDGNGRLNQRERFNISKIQPDGNSLIIPDDQYAKVINTILPEDLSEYFFYEEKKFSTIGERKNLKQSVEDFCGLTSMNYGIVDLGKVIVGFNEDLKNLNSSKLGSLIQETQNLSQRKDIRQAVLETAKKEIEFYQSELTKIQDELLAYAQDDRIRNDYIRYSKHEEELKNNISKDEKDVISYFNDQVFGFLLNNAAFDKVDNVLSKDEPNDPVDVVSGVEAKTIDEIIKRGYCICGQRIDNENEAFNHLMALRKVVPPNSLSASVKAYKNENAIYRSMGDSFSDNISEKYKRLRNDKNELNDTGSYLLEIKGKIDNTRDTSDLKAKQVQYTEKLNENIRKKDAAIKDVSVIDTKIEHNQKQISILSKRNEHNKQIEKCQEYARVVKDLMSQKLSEKQETVLKELNKYVSLYFSKLYHGELSIKITEDYKIKTYNTYNGNELSTKISSGTNDVKNFAFVFALEQLAKNKINEADEDISEQYPLVLDGPFSHVDGGHIKNLCNILPNVSNQVILAVSEKDWNLVRGYLEKYVGSMWKMQLNEGTTTIQEFGGVENV